MNISARNQFKTTVTAVSLGVVNTELELTTQEGDKLYAVITNRSFQAMNLDVGSCVTALVKASWVIVSKEKISQISARNNLCGNVKEVIRGKVSTEVDITLPGGSIITAVITNEAADKLAIKTDEPLCALFKASNVIISL